MNQPQLLIKAKRDGQRLSSTEIKSFLRAYLDSKITEYQMSAMLMAVYFSGLDPEELAAWTDAMVESGSTLKFNQKYVVDKHSTGGVGDKTSFLVAPMVAVLGCTVPMISGRSLGHTGGTLDKLEGIPGLKIPKTAEHIQKLVEDHGMCFAGQTETMCPLDRKLYALRDVTGTVESPNLIAASIMSKKLAEGIGGLTMDVKCGFGAFMKTLEAAQGLKQRMKAIADAKGLQFNGVISNMNQPLGEYAGVRPEIHEVLEVYQGRGAPDLRALCIKLASQMLTCSGREPNAHKATQLAEKTLVDGSAYKKFCDVIQAQGGDVHTFEQDNFYLKSDQTHGVTSEQSGFITEMDTEKLGNCLAALGAGRVRTDDLIDHQVGCRIHKRIGDPVQKGEPVLTIYASRRSPVKDVLQKLSTWFKVGPQSTGLQQPLIWEEF